MTWKWHGITIPEKWCFTGKKCTPDCMSYDMGWLYMDEDDEN